MRFLLDSGIASDYAYRRNNVYARTRREMRAGNRVGIGSPVVGELLGGAYFSSTRTRNLPIINRCLACFVIWSFNEAAARKYGELWAALRASGRSMQVPDIQIAAIAMTLGNCVVVTKDSDLRAVPGLNVENWTVA